MNAEDMAGKAIDTLILYLEKIDSVETEDHRDEIIGTLEDTIRALDGITFPDSHCGIDEDREYEIWKDNQICGEAR